MTELQGTLTILRPLLLVIASTLVVALRSGR